MITLRHLQAFSWVFWDFINWQASFLKVAAFTHQKCKICAGILCVLKVFFRLAYP